MLRAVRRLRIRETVRSFLVRALAFGPRAFCFLRRDLGRLPVRAVQCKLRNGRLFRLFRSGAFFRCITHGGYAEAAVCANDAGHLLGAAQLGQHSGLVLRACFIQIFVVEFQRFVALLCGDIAQLGFQGRHKLRSIHY